MRRSEELIGSGAAVGEIRERREKSEKGRREKVERESRERKKGNLDEGGRR